MYGSKSFMNYKRKELSPDLTPLIDVVFLLLIFFMVASSFNSNAAIKLELPKTAVDESVKKLEKIEVVLGVGGELKILIKGMSRSEELMVSDRGKLREIVERHINDIEDKRVSLLADRSVPHGEIVEMMSLLKESGVEILDIEAEKES